MRRTLSCARAVWIIPWVGLVATAAGQTTQPTNAELLAELHKMSQRIANLEARHQQEREADQEKIRQLQAQVAVLQEGSFEAQRARAVEGVKAAAPPPSTWAGLLDLTGGGSEGGRNLLNPDTTVFLDLGGSVSSDGDNNALNRFNLREAELDLRAAVSPAADGVLIVTLGEDITSDRSGKIDIDRNVDIEEGYINFHTLPYDLALKVGQFRPAFGRNNQLHTHDLPQVTRPLVVQDFLGPEGFHALGASLSWLVPNPWDKYVEVTADVVNADAGDEGPLFGGPNADNPAVIGHIKFFDDVTDTSSIDLGGSYIFTHTGPDSDDDAHAFGLDATYTWTDPDPSRFRSFTLQGEAVWAQNDVERPWFRVIRNRSFGAYVFGQYQFARDWYTGLRVDYSEFPNSQSRGLSDSDVALVPYLTWYVSEFLRLRLEYQHRRRDGRGAGDGDEDAVFLQSTFVIGAHPPHPYWVHR